MGLVSWKIAASVLDVEEVSSMKVSASVKRRCPKCRVIKRNRRVMIICEKSETQAATGLGPQKECERWLVLKASTCLAISGCLSV